MSRLTQSRQQALLKLKELSSRAQQLEWHLQGVEQLMAELSRQIDLDQAVVRGDLSHAEYNDIIERIGAPEKIDTASLPHPTGRPRKKKSYTQPELFGHPIDE